MSSAGLHAAAAAIAVTLSPNPSTGSIVVNGLPSNARNISIENELGERVLELDNSRMAPLTIDLTTFAWNLLSALWKRRFRDDKKDRPRITNSIVSVLR